MEHFIMSSATNVIKCEQSQKVMAKMVPLLNLFRKMAPNLGFALFLCLANSDNWGYLLIF